MKIITRPHLDTAEIHTWCPVCGKHHSFECSMKQANEVKDYKDGSSTKLIQQILPEDEFTATDRESVQTGLCDQCYDEICGHED